MFEVCIKKISKAFKMINFFTRLQSSLFVMWSPRRVTWSKIEKCKLNNELILRQWDGSQPILLAYIQTFDQEYNELIVARVIGPWIPSFDHFLECIHVLHLDLWWIYERCQALLRALHSQQFFPWCEENDQVHYYGLQESGLKILIVPYYSKLRQSVNWVSLVNSIIFWY